jgi:hypothetical protein
MSRFARYVAVHEAGHAVAETLLFGGMTEARLWHEGRQTRGLVVPLPTDNASARDMSISLYAGMAAHARLYRWGLTTAMLAGGLQDFKDVTRLCSEVAAAQRIHDIEAFKLAWHRVAEQYARALVTAHWAWITRVANSLVEHGHITGVEVKALS